MRMLEPRREDQERFLPFPQHLLLNGRPRSVCLTHKPRSQAAGQPCTGSSSVMHRRNRVKPCETQGMSQAEEGLAVAPEQGMMANAFHTGSIVSAETGFGEKGVPGLELSGVTAEDLNDAGILYDEERHLLGSSAAAATAGTGAATGADPAIQLDNKHEPTNTCSDSDKVKWKDEDKVQLSGAAATSGLSRPATPGAKVVESQHKVGHV
jgi:hypothetical protein